MLARTARRGWSATPGQVNGNYAVWNTCTPRCEVFLYDIAAAAKTRVPNPLGRQQYTPSVSADGTVYFVSSGNVCGEAVKLERKSPDRASRVILRIFSGYDSLRTAASADRNGTTRVYFDRIHCRLYDSDVLRVDDP